MQDSRRSYACTTVLMDLPCATIINPGAQQARPLATAVQPERLMRCALPSTVALREATASHGWP